MHTVHPVSPRSSRAFSLIELAVVLVVVGVIAAIAIPTFHAVIDRSRVRAAAATQSAVARNVTAILAFNDGTTPSEALSIALSELHAAAPGVSAADPINFVLVAGNVASTERTEISWEANSSTLAWAQTYDSERVVLCHVALDNSGSICWVENADAADHTGLYALGATAPTTTTSTTTTSTTTTSTTTTSITTTTLPLDVPSAPTAPFVDSYAPAQFYWEFSAPESEGSSPIIEYQVTITGTGLNKSCTIGAGDYRGGDISSSLYCGAGFTPLLPAEVIVSGEVYTVTIVAVNSYGASAPLLITYTTS